MTSPRRPGRPLRSLTRVGAWLLALLAAVGLLIFGVGTASAHTLPDAGNHVRASAPETITAVGVSEHVRAGQGRGPPVLRAGFVVATGVAANTADHVLPIGPGSEKAWTVLNRIDSKGAPLPGYKGGSVFKNSQGKLPETPGVTYREWDVNPYTKGVDRGAERIVTGSDGSAYWTGDHYDTFLTFRGPTG